MAASQLPLHYLLALKSWSPVQYLTRLSHEELNPYHRFLGRILTGFFLAHGLFYLNYYVQLSILSKRIRSADVLLGLSTLTTLLVLNSTALAKVRTWSYRLFFGSHVLLSILILPLLYFHVSHARVYVLEAAAIYVILIVQRNISSTSVFATITQLPGSPLISIRIPLTSRLARRRYFPGQHIYLSLPATGDSPLNKLRHHPFTIATLPVPSASPAEMQLVIRPLRGTTQLLSTLAQPSQTPPKSQILIEGPYGASRSFLESLRNYRRILLVAGGVGATFTLPIYRHLLQQQKQQPDRPSSTNQQVRFVWSVRSIADASWGLEQLQTQEDGDDRSNTSSSFSRQQDTGLASLPSSKTSTHACDIYISSSSSSSPAPPFLPSSPSTHELHSRPPPTPSPSSTSYQNHTGRPNLRGIVDEIFSDLDTEAEVDEYESDDENDDGNQIARLGDSEENSTSKNIRVAVLVCGPVGMGAALRREVGRWVRRGRHSGEREREGGWDVFWHDEEFGW